MSTYDYQPINDYRGHIDCGLYPNEEYPCWGKVALVSADYSGEGETMYRCRAHRYCVDDFYIMSIEYMPNPDTLIDEEMST